MAPSPEDVANDAVGHERNEERRASAVDDALPAELRVAQAGVRTREVIALLHEEPEAEVLDVVERDLRIGPQLEPRLLQVWMQPRLPQAAPEVLVHRRNRRAVVGDVHAGQAGHDAS